MSASFSSCLSGGNCGICQESIIDNDYVAHSGEHGIKHPMHRNCIKEWLKHHPRCPICSIQCDDESLLNWKQKVIKELKLIVTDPEARIIIIIALTIELISVIIHHSTRNARDTPQVLVDLKSSAELAIVIAVATVAILEITIESRVVRRTGGAATALALIKGVASLGLILNIARRLTENTLN